MQGIGKMSGGREKRERRVKYEIVLKASCSPLRLSCAELRCDAMRREVAALSFMATFPSFRFEQQLVEDRPKSWHPAKETELADVGGEMTIIHSTTTTTVASSSQRLLVTCPNCCDCFQYGLAVVVL